MLLAVGVGGGSTYDGVVALAARDAQPCPVTLEHRARRTHQRLNVPHEIMAGWRRAGLDIDPDPGSQLRVSGASRERIECEICPPMRSMGCRIEQTRVGPCPRRNCAMVGVPRA